MDYFFGCLCRLRRTKFEPQVEEATMEVANGDAERIVAKTIHLNDFDAEHLKDRAVNLGEGTFGTTFRATIVGDSVVVRVLTDLISDEEFEDMVCQIEKIRHENLLPLKYIHYGAGDLFLVYEYMRNGSLSALLHGNRGNGKTPLNWESRTRIATGVAGGIAHIHSLDPSISHGNIKSSNVFFTPTFEVRVSEFGIANVVRPTRFDGYCAPEVNDANRASQKADVYSFGVLLLELFTRKDPNDPQLKDEGLDLPRWMISAVDNEWTSELFDLELLVYENVGESLLKLFNLAFSCTVEDPRNRPSMAEVMNQIEKLNSSTANAHGNPATDKNVLDPEII